MRNIRVGIVDDESPARDKIKHFLEGDTRFQVVCEAGTGLAAIAQIEAANPELLFLDIQMPGMNGFEVLDNLALHTLPRVIFTTAYDAFAIRAFEVHALDYLLKPFDRERFSLALTRAVSDLQPSDSEVANMQAFMALVHQNRPATTRLLVRDQGKILFIKPAEIRIIRSEEKYVRIWTANRRFLHRASLNELEKKLDAGQFFRVHRTAIVNIAAVTALEPDHHGDYLLILEDGSRQKLGRSFRDRFLQLLEGG